MVNSGLIDRSVMISRLHRLNSNATGNSMANQIWKGSLLLLNLVRIVSLFYIQIHFPRAFEVMHIEVWQVLFIFLAIALWALWAWWAVRRGAAGFNTSAQPDEQVNATA